MRISAVFVDISFLITLCVITDVAESEENYEKIEVGSPCDKEVTLFRMSGPSIHAGEMKIYWYKTIVRSRRDEPCDLKIRGYYLYDRLAFQFTDVELGPDDCIELKQRDRYHGRDLYVDIVTDYDECDDYLCENGRCIPDDIQCNKNNPCGDHSECKNLTGWEIFGIVVGCVAGLVLLCCCCGCCCCRNSKKNSSGNETTGTIRNNAIIGQETVPLNERENTGEFTGLPSRQLDEGHSTAPVFVYATVSNQSHFDTPPTYNSVNSENIRPTPSGQYPISSSGERGTATAYPYTSGQYPISSSGERGTATGYPYTSGQCAANYTAPTAPSLDNEAGPPPPPSYDDVMANEEKFKVT